MKPIKSSSMATILGLTVLLSVSSLNKTVATPIMSGYAVNSTIFDQYESNLKSFDENYEALRVIEITTELAAILRQSDAALAKQDFSTANSLLLLAEQTAPNKLTVLLARSQFHAVQSHWLESEATLIRAINIYPSALPPRLILGTLQLLGLNDPEKAVQTYRSATKLSPNNPVFHYALATALAYNNENQLALASFKRAAQLAPNNPLPYADIGQLYIKQNNFKESLTAFSKAIIIQPNFIQARIALADILMLNSQPSQAINQYQKVLNIAPDFAPGWVKLGMFYQQTGEPDKAEQAYLTAIKLDSNQAIAFNNLALLAGTDRNRLSEANAWANKAYKLAPQVGSYQLTLGWILRKQGKLDAAEMVLKQAAKTIPNNAYVFYNLGLVQYQQGKREFALTAFETALNINPNLYWSEDARDKREHLLLPK